MIYAGIDIGGTSIKSGIMDGDSGELIASVQTPFVIENGIEGTAMDIRKAVVQMLEENHLSMDELDGIGVSVPGSISRDKTMVLNAYNLGFHNAPVQAEIEKVFPGKRVVLGNDADMAAMAELNGGIFKDRKTAILLTLGTGIGGGVIINGRLFTGGNGNGTEPGHVILDMHGPMCTCGNRGCNETLCASTWLVKQGKIVCENNPDSLITKKADGNPDNMNAQIVIDSAREGDPEAVKLFDQYLDSLSSCIASFISILDPEVIGIGGGVSGAGDFLLEPLRKRVRTKTFFDMDYPILKAKYGNTAGMIGAATLAKTGY